MMVDVAIQKMWFSLLLSKSAEFLAAFRLSNSVVEPGRGELGKRTYVMPCLCPGFGMQGPVCCFIILSGACSLFMTDKVEVIGRGQGFQDLQVCVPLVLLRESPNMPSLPFHNPSHRPAVPIWSAKLGCYKGADILCVPVTGIVF